MKNPVSCKWNENRTIIGNYIYLDHDAQKPTGLPADLKCFNVLTRMKSEDQTWGTDYEGHDVFRRYPYFINPSRNVGHSEDTDKPLYGGTVNYEPMNMNPIVNGANPEFATSDILTPNNNFSGTGAATDVYNANCKTISYDSGLIPRTYGGAPDAGAIENTRLPAAGTVLYVTPDGAGKRDGSSWSNAIAGNTVYCLDDVAGPGLASGDQLDSGSDRVLDVDGNPVLTTDAKYSGGFGRSYIASWKTGATTTTTVTKAWVTEKNVYDEGDKAGQEEFVSTGTTPVVTTAIAVTNEGSDAVGFTPGFQYDPRYPYGEISGQSRTFWRANPFNTTQNLLYPSPSAEGFENTSSSKGAAAFIEAVNDNGWISNSRQERYVGGLQYAVEKAAAYNALADDDEDRQEGVDSVRVWVSNGKYTDYKGFIMRDNTTVMGSFPAVKQGSVMTPGMSERHALMSAVVDIPKAQTAKNLSAEDYETILQISDINPKKDSITLNTDAVKYRDDDLNLYESIDTRIFEYKDQTVVHHYALEDLGESDVTDSYVKYPTFTVNDSQLISTDYRKRNEVKDGVRYMDFGLSSDGDDCWHISYPNYTNNVGSSLNHDNQQYNVYDLSSNYESKTAAINWIWLRDGSLTGVNIWQTMKDVAAGEYKFEAYIGGGYRNAWDDVTSNTNIDIYLLDENDAVLATRHVNNIGGRSKAWHYIIPFTMQTAGNVTMKIVVGEGTRAEEDPNNIPAMGSNPNRREVWMSNLKLSRVEKGTSYVLLTTENSTIDKTDVPEEYVENGTVVQGITSTAVQTRTALRKRVLTMPDVTSATYCGGAAGNPTTHSETFSDELAHTDRVTGDAKSQRTAATTTRKKEDPHYVAYTDVVWDGFTIRHGFLYDEGMHHGGGAGVNIYEGAHLRNCIVTDNFAGAIRMKGAGIFCDGATSTIEGCFVLNNTATRGSGMQQLQEFAGGMFMYEGTCFNSLFAKNYAHGSGGGVGFCVGRFYNNTIAYNTCRLKEATPNSSGTSVEVEAGGGIALATNSAPNLFIANTIIYGNNGMAIRDRDGQTSGSTTFNQVNSINPFLNCYIQSATTISTTNEASQKNIINWTEEDPTHFGIGNTFLNGVAASAANSPFVADVEGTFGDAADNNDFRLTSKNPNCVNMGTEAFAGNFKIALMRKRNWSETQVNNQFIYKSVAAAVLPDNDVAFADRIQDCAIDIGAYEYDGTVDIEPDLTQEGKAIFYVSQNGAGKSTGNSPENAACSMKLQKILDAAGRWRYAARYLDDAKNVTNFTKAVLTRELTTQGVIAEGADATEALNALKDRQVIVKLAGDDASAPRGFAYSPTRSTETEPNIEENILLYSFIVPRGVQVLGGYTEDEKLKLADQRSEGEDATATWPGFSDETRDPLGYPTRLSGIIYNEQTETEGNVFHVVTFTENLFSTEEILYEEDGHNQQSGQLSIFNTEADRAVVDGVFIQDGYASGTDGENRMGGGAIVTDFAHVRNCIVEGNEAVDYGGGLYLQPAALVSGSIIKDNTANEGGGLYIKPADGSEAKPNVHLYTSTVFNNTATLSGGGISYSTDSEGHPNLIANSCAFWHNSANDLANVAGSFDAMTLGTTVGAGSYPFNYCGIENSRVTGVNNLLLPTIDGEGVRWNHHDRYEDGDLDGSILYVPITLSSILSRAGMPYSDLTTARNAYPTLETEDLSRMKRMDQDADEYIIMATIDGSNTVTRVAKNNDFIDMGARVLNRSFEVQVQEQYIMRRLFVAKTENLPDPQQLEYLQENENTDALSMMYRQMGSSFANPFHRLGDALDYIMDVRKRYTEDVNGTRTYPYRDTRFEVFVSEGEFYPFRDAYGHQGSARTNTFVIPEGVTVVGGIQVDASTTDHYYCQEGYGESGSATVIVPTTGGGDITLNGATTQAIRDTRERHDYNGNNVFEPWEMKTLSKLMGNAVDANSEGTTNVYHVITCLADEDQVGKLPTMYSDDDCLTPITLDESTLSTTSDTRQTQLLSFLTKESEASKDRRTIILDGLQITGGHANDIEEDHAVYREAMVKEENETSDEFSARQGRQNATQLTYFRGGGILVEGNWDSGFLNQGNLPEVLGVAKRDIPLIVMNCEFQNNQAGNGGAIYSNGTLYIVGSHFTQNLAMGPQTTNDQKFIPWTAGGAIATNYGCNVWNTLFDNNEARRGNYSILGYDVNPRNNSGITNADARQGSGGVISSSETSVVRMANCDVVKNKALQYPAIYNFYDNGLRTQNPDRYGPGHHFAINTLFWGNEVPDEYKNMEVAIANGESAPGLRKRYHVANFGPSHNQEVLYFSAYEDGLGLEPTLPVSDAARKAQRETVLEESALPTIKTGTFFGNNFTTYNNNQHISSINTAADGPYFVQPSSIAGIDGYMQNADWLVSRLNALIDNGWSYLKQQVDQPSVTSTLLTTQFFKPGDAATYNYTSNPALNGKDGFSGAGFYNTYSKDVYDRFHGIGFNDILPLADEDYMKYTRESVGGTYNMRRISTHPKVGEQKVYVDIGIYEYQYIQLSSLGSEVDVVWVGPNGTGDGSTAKNCANDLQTAIETLLLSRNGHDKMVKMIGGTQDEPAEFSPVNTTTNGKLAFFVKVPTDDTGVSIPSGISVDHALGIKSLTIRGGYSASTPDDSDGEELRDVEQYPVVLKMSHLSGYTDDQLDHLFVVEDAQQRETYRNYISDRNTSFVNRAVPVILDGLTFENSYAKERTSGDDINEGGAAIYYAQQFYRTDKSGTQSGTLQAADEPKLTIKNCIVRNCGHTESGQVPAVLVKDGGGDALVVNSLFHGNQGNPLEAVGTSVVNSTFARNGGHLKLSGTSQLHNSIIWQDNGGSGTQYEGVSSGTDMTYNAIMGYTNTDETQDNHNIALTAADGDMFTGPNFVDPDNGNFHINVSNRVLGRASKEKYCDLVPYFATYPDYANNNTDSWSNEGEAGKYAVQRTATNALGETVTYWFHSVQRAAAATLSDAQIAAKSAGSTAYTEAELGGVARLLGNGMERGAYESDAVLQRVLYVAGDGGDLVKDGTDWEKTYAVSDLQTAVDVASVWYLMNNSQRAYVFVKGDDVPVPALTMRDGVSVYGSLPKGFFGEAEKTDGSYSDAAISQYIRRVEANRHGIAAKGVSSNTVRGLSAADGATFNEGFLLDGFWITANGSQTSPVVSLNQPGSAVKGCVIAGNTVTGGQPVVSVQQGLLYNSLVYGNDAATAVTIGTNGYSLNNTVVTTNSGQTAVSGTNVRNTIAVDGGTQGNMFALYLAARNAYTLPTYLTEWQPYHYQLHELSTLINSREETTDVNTWLPAALQGYVNFSHDRDVLGNPRRIGSAVDHGCFETWKIAEATIEATDETDTEYDSNYGGHLYPHAGSTVYVGDGGNLLFQQGRFSDSNPVSPAYLLVQQGGSVYGQGNTLRLPYVAIEKTLTGRYGLCAVPYAYRTGNTITIADDNGYPKQTATAYSHFVYDGQARSAYNYVPKTTDSGCWQTAETALGANKGWLIDRGDATAATRLRFTDWADTNGEYIYTEGADENGNTDKTVTLTQYNSNALDADSKPLFTRQENMGWNLVGMPFLVSNYATYGDGQDYQMNIPHVIYGINEATGNFSTEQSWTEGASLNVGNAFFTQTAAIGDSETLTFRLPVYTASAAAPARQQIAIAQMEPETSSSLPFRGGLGERLNPYPSDVVDVYPQPEADTRMDYHLGTDGLKWMSFTSEAAQIYVYGDAGVRMSLASEAPVDADIPLGVVIPEAGSWLISLPSAEAYSDCSAVWVIDRLTGTSTNLLRDNFILNTNRTGDIPDRLFLRFNGSPIEDHAAGQTPPRVLKVIVRNGHCPLKPETWNLKPETCTDTLIEVYNAGGLPVCKGTVSDVLRLRLPDGVYIIKARTLDL